MSFLHLTILNLIVSKPTHARSSGYVCNNFVLFVVMKILGNHIYVHGDSQEFEDILHSLTGNGKDWKNGWKQKLYLEKSGIDPETSCMLSKRSTI